MTTGGQAKEIAQELKGLLSGRVGIADGIAPPLLFVAANSLWGLGWGLVAGLVSAGLIVVWRLVRGRPLRFALAGLGGTLIAIFFALRAGEASSFFLPGIISGSVTAGAIVVSIFARRPFVAWTSWITRGWPLGWYWHPQVLPAYLKTSWLWAAFFTTRAYIQWQLFTTGDTAALAVARVVMGWPALAVLLVLTYILGRRWLVRLSGPSVEEYLLGADQPWSGQPRGF